jgi:peptidoglycan/xylan/chitin deacetylase (PgdA/CDA1 family)
MIIRLRRRPLILRYHRVYPDGREPLYELGVPRALFEAHLDFLVRHFTVVGLEDVCAAVIEGRRPPRRVAAITFDDGYKDNLTEALPALRARRLPATVFVAAGLVESGGHFWWDRCAAAVANAPRGTHLIRIGSSSERVALEGLPSRRQVVDRVCEHLKVMPHAAAMECLAGLEESFGRTRGPGHAVLTWAEVRRLQAGGIEIGSHTLDHPVLSRVGDKEAERQIVESRRLIEARLGSPVRFFAYPNGKRDDISPEVVAAVRRAGYRAAVTTIEGRPGRSSDPFRLERIGATVGASTDAQGRFDEALFAAELSGVLGALFLRRRRDRALH